jgi:hypothetical protein
VLLDAYYESAGISENVIAYRRLGMANYHFSKDALEFIKNHRPCVAICFDVSGFFDNLDHSILKEKLKRILGTKELPQDWYQVYKRVSRYSYIEKACLNAHHIFKDRVLGSPKKPIATIQEINNAGIAIFKNTNRYGIPQGTPISSSLSNLYMIDIDSAMSAAAKERRALYQRYSDDILVICSPQDEVELVSLLRSEIDKHRLFLNDEKEDRALFDGSFEGIIQYLGFNLTERGALIRQSSLSRKWRSFKRSIRRIGKIGNEAIISGKSTRIYTYSLRRRFQPVGVKNFSSYARKSAKVLNSVAILKQIRKFERAVAKALRELNPPKP